MALPKFILLKSTTNNKYLRYRKEDSKHAFLQFSQEEKEENAEIQYAKFEVQKSEAVEGFVHIRCCYNNKYWVRKSSESNSIVVEANEPEEDQSKWSCTLFKVVHLDADVDTAADVPVDAEVDVSIPHIPKPQKIRLVHIDQLGQHECVQPSNTVDLVISDGNEQSRTTKEEEGVFLAYNAALIVVLPDRVAFVSLNNQKYMAATIIDGTAYLEFKATDISERGVTHAVAQWWNGEPNLVRFRNTSFENTVGIGFWKGSIRTPNMIVVDQEFNQWGDNGAIYYTPLRVGASNVITFYNWWTTTPARYVNAGPRLSMDLALGQNGSNIDQFSMFEIIEPVRFRQISNMTYNLSNSRVYDIASVEKYRDERSNNTSVEQTGSFSVSYEVSQSMNWEDSVTVSRSLSASMSASIPFVGISFGVELSSAQEKTITWGNEVSETRSVSYVQDLAIPPGKKIILRVVATRAQCDVPFTCQVHDVVADGEIRNYTKFDGRYTGANEFGFDTVIDEENL